MNFFDINPMHTPYDAQYFFDVCIINIAVRESLGGEWDDLWCLEGVCEPRPYVYHVFKDDDFTFDEDRNFDIEIDHHCVLEVSPTLGICFYCTDGSEGDELGEFADSDEFWRF